MLISVDVGNTAVSVGAFKGQRLCATWRLSPEVNRTADEYSLLMLGMMEQARIAATDVDAAVIGSVVHGLDATFDEVCRQCFNVQPLVAGTGAKTGLRVRYDPPREVGVDRVADAVAAIRLYGAPLIIVDLGTATVFDAINSDGDYLGGAIAPGLTLGAEALFQKAAKLYRVEIERPENAVGRNTVTALQSGLIYGHICLIEGMVARFKAELGMEATVVATGGHGKLIASESEVIDEVNEELTLVGLRMIYELNRG